MYTFEIYKDKRNEFRWRFTSGNKKNKKIIADSGEGYASKGNCTRAVKRLIKVINIKALEIKFV